MVHCAESGWQRLPAAPTARQAKVGGFVDQSDQIAFRPLGDAMRRGNGIIWHSPAPVLAAVSAGSAVKRVAEPSQTLPTPVCWFLPSRVSGYNAVMPHLPVPAPRPSGNPGACFVVLEPGILRRREQAQADFQLCRNARQHGGQRVRQLVHQAANFPLKPVTPGSSAAGVVASAGAANPAARLAMASHRAPQRVDVMVMPQLPKGFSISPWLGVLRPGFPGQLTWHVLVAVAPTSGP
jgi:hypothetical protein